ncbi:MAG: polysaccharide deacetylase family protein [Deltaproteobacteria bacterium]|nr:polysaccharide deacetylase family protein [Deltaproteobacteria bacterium]
MIFFSPSVPYADVVLGVFDEIPIPEKKHDAPGQSSPSSHVLSGERLSLASDRQREMISVAASAVLPQMTAHLHGASLKPHDEGFPAIQERRWMIGMMNMPVMEPEMDKPPARLPSDARGRWHEYTPPDITRGSDQRKRLTITFDGGSDDGDAEAILDALSTRGLTTTIFLTGAFIRKYPALVRRMLLDGHEIGNHTMNHPHLTDFERTFRHNTLSGVDKASVQRELIGAAEAFKAITGEEMSPLWRAPYGEVNDEIRRWAFEAGYIHIGWTSNNKKRESLDTLDWVSDMKSRFYRSPYEIKKRILDFGKDGNGINGGIVLMHLGTGRRSGRAASILPDLLDALERRGYELVKVSDLVEATPQFQAVKSVRKERVLEGMVRIKYREP